MKKGFRAFAAKLLRPGDQEPEVRRPIPSVEARGEKFAFSEEKFDKLREMAMGLLDPDVEGAIVLRIRKTDENAPPGEPCGLLEAQCSVDAQHLMAYTEAIRRVADAIEADATNPMS